MARLAAPGAMLAPTPDGSSFGVFIGADRRRRPLARLSEAQARALAADGAIVAAGAGYVITSAGRARAQRTAAPPAEAYLAQHATIIDRSIVDADGDLRPARGLDALASVRRLAHLRDADGAPWLSAPEMAAAARLRNDWERGQVGLTPATDWAAPPASGAVRGPGNGREAALTRGLDARTRLAAQLDALAPPLRRAVTAVCLDECGLEQLERRERWPPRSAKVALKLALAQLALVR